MAQEPESVRAAVRELRDAGVQLASIGLRHRAAFPASSGKGLAIMELEPANAGAREVAGVWEQAWSMLTAPNSPGVRTRPLR